MKKILRYFSFILYNFGLLIGFICKIFANIFTKKCRYNTKDIVAVELWGGWIAEPFWYFVSNDKDMLKNTECSHKVFLNNKNYNVVLNSINAYEILKYKRYILNNPFISFKDYSESLDSEDADAFEPRITIYFLDGKKKKITGDSKRIRDLINDVEVKISDQNLFD